MFLGDISASRVFPELLQPVITKEKHFRAVPLEKAAALRLQGTEEGGPARSRLTAAAVAGGSALCRRHETGERAGRGAASRSEEREGRAGGTRGEGLPSAPTDTLRQETSRLGVEAAEKGGEPATAVRGQVQPSCSGKASLNRGCSDRKHKKL